MLYHFSADLFGFILFWTDLNSLKKIFQDEICLQVSKRYYVNWTLPVFIGLKLLSENTKFEENFEIRRIVLSKLKLKPILCGKCVYLKLIYYPTKLSHAFRLWFAKSCLKPMLLIILERILWESHDILLKKGKVFSTKLVHLVQFLVGAQACLSHRKHLVQIIWISNTHSISSVCVWRK